MEGCQLDKSALYSPSISMLVLQNIYKQIYSEIKNTHKSSVSPTSISMFLQRTRRQLHITLIDRAEDMFELHGIMICGHMCGTGRHYCHNSNGVQPMKRWLGRGSRFLCGGFILLLPRHFANTAAVQYLPDSEAVKSCGLCIGITSCVHVASSSSTIRWQWRVIRVWCGRDTMVSLLHCDGIGEDPYDRQTRPLRSVNVFVCGTQRPHASFRKLNMIQVISQHITCVCNGVT